MIILLVVGIGIVISDGRANVVPWSVGFGSVGFGLGSSSSNAAVGFAVSIGFDRSRSGGGGVTSSHTTGGTPNRSIAIRTRIACGALTRCETIFGTRCGAVGFCGAEGTGGAFARGWSKSIWIWIWFATNGG